MLNVKELMLDDGSVMIACNEIIDDKNVYMKLTLCGEDSFYEGTIPSSEMKSMANTARMNLSSYKNEIQKAFLTSCPNDAADYTFSLTASKLAWKKYLSEENLKINLGHIEMLKANVPISVFQTIKKVLQTLMSQQKKIEESKRHCNEADSELKIATEELSRLAEVKSVVEVDLYSKFSLVLNKKKEKIRKLRDELDDLIKNQPSTSVGAKEAGKNSFNESTDEDSNSGKARDEMDLSFGTSLESNESISIRPRVKRKKNDQKTVFSTSTTIKTNKHKENKKEMSADDLFDDL